MPRYKLTVEYDGGPFVGWQRQANGRSVQEAIEDAVTRLSGENVRISGAGRTDAGVHALGQIAHLDLTREWRGEQLRNGLNFHLRPEPVAILAAEPAPPGFDARFSALGRHYVYRIVNRDAPLAIEGGRAWHVRKPLDAEAMNDAAQALLGTHDFTTFRAVQCQAKSPIKTLDRLQVRRAGEEIIVEASARSFLHNQVRSLVGSLNFVGVGKWTGGDLMAALEARDRNACGAVAPPDGLYLVRVDYPPA